MNTRSLLLKILGIMMALSTVLTAFTTVLAADTYPSKPVRLIIAYPPGGSADLVGRPMAAHLSKSLSQQVFVDNRGGADGLVGAEVAAKAKPDGYTLFLNNNSFTVLPAFYEKITYDPVKAFTPIAKLLTGSFALVVNPRVPVNSVKEFIALAKQKHGQLLCAMSGTGGTPRLMAEQFKMTAGIDFQIVNFKGGGPAIIDLLGGHTDAYIGPLISALSHVQSGKLKALAVGGMKRSDILPDVPTMMEAGGFPGFDFTQWNGLIAPAGTPTPIIDRLKDEAKAILALGEIRKQYLSLGMEIDYLGPTEFGQLMEREVTLWKRVVKDANIKLE